MQDAIPLPALFVAHSSYHRFSSAMARLATDLESISPRVITWAEPLDTGFLFASIRTRIDESELILAETSDTNPNVLFEVGYAIGSGKRVYQLIDNDYAARVSLAPLEAVTEIRYSGRDDVKAFLLGANLGANPLYEQLGLDRAVSHSGRLYFIPARNARDINNAALAICKESAFDVGTIDMRDSDYDSLVSQAQSIAQADVVVLLLVSEDVKDHHETNAQTMLFAGIAEGLGKDFIVLAQEPLRRYLDLEEHIVPFKSEEEVEFRLKRALARMVESRVTGRRLEPPRSVRAVQSPLDGLFLGSLDARADFSLTDYFVATPEFIQAERGDRHLFVGAKGAGKTALYETLLAEITGRQQLVVAIAPAAFEFPRLAAVFDEHVQWAHWEFVYHSFWRFIILTEILKGLHENYFDHLLREAGGKVPRSLDRSSNQNRRFTPKRDNYAEELIAWIDSNQEIMYLDFASRANAVLRQIEEASTSGGDLRESYEQLLHHAAMYDIARYIAEFANEFPIRLVVDDLDRNWTPRVESGSKLVVALLDVIHDLMDDLKGRIQPTVFIRRDVFDWLRKNDPEILRRDAGHLIWTTESLELLVARRIASGVRSDETDPAVLWRLAFPEFIGDKSASEFIIARTHQRPRDVIQFCQKAIESAQRAGRTEVALIDITSAWESAGSLMIGQIEAEFAFRFPQIETLAVVLMDGPVARRWDELAELLIDTALRIEPCPDWMREALDHPEQFLSAMYETGIIGIETAGGTQWFESTRSFDEVRLGAADNFTVIVHPAFHRYFRCLGTDPTVGWGI